MKTLLVLGVFLVALTLFNTVITYRLIKSIDDIWDQFRQLKEQLSIAVSDIVDELQKRSVKEEPAQSALTSAEYWKKVEDGGCYLDSTLFKYFRYDLNKYESLGVFESFLANNYDADIEEPLVCYVQYLSKRWISKIRAELLAEVNKRAVIVLGYPELKEGKKIARCTEYRGGIQCVNQNFYNSDLDCFDKQEFLFLLDEYHKLPSNDRYLKILKKMLAESRFCKHYSFYEIKRTLVEEFKDPEDNFLYHLLCDNK